MHTKAPCSSGLGNATVGKLGSGSCCSATVVIALEWSPISFRARMTGIWPTPCIGVVTNLTEFVEFLYVSLV